MKGGHGFVPALPIPPGTPRRLRSTYAALDYIQRQRPSVARARRQARWFAAMKADKNDEGGTYLQYSPWRYARARISAPQPPRPDRTWTGAAPPMRSHARQLAQSLHARERGVIRHDQFRSVGLTRLRQLHTRFFKSFDRGGGAYLEP